MVFYVDGSYRLHPWTGGLGVNGSKEVRILDLIKNHQQARTKISCYKDQCQMYTHHVCCGGLQFRPRFIGFPASKLVYSFNTLRLEF